MTGSKYSFTSVDLTHVWLKNEHNEGGFILSWTEENTGFGEFAFVKQDTEGEEIICENEYMSKEFILAALKAFLDKCTIQDLNEKDIPNDNRCPGNPQKNDAGNDD